MVSIFKAPDWDTDIPDTNLNFNKKMKKPKFNDQVIKKKKKNSPSATTAINTAASIAVKKMAKKPTTAIKDNNNEPGKYVRMNKNNSLPATTASTLIDAKSLQMKKRKIKHEEHSSFGTEIITLPKRIKIKNGDKAFNHVDSDTPSPTIPLISQEKKNDNLFHKKGLKLKNVQQQKKKNEPTTSTKLSRKKMVKKVASDDHHEQCNQTNGNGVVNEGNGKNDGNQVNAQQLSPTITTPTPTLTFREQLMANLKGSRFRYLNEMLYTTDGKNAANIFKEDPLAFKAYHDGYRQQVQHWPMNPLDRIIKAIRKMPKNLIVADFGCGEGRLAKSISQKTYSLDLMSAHDGVIACDMANTPLESDSINVAVYCLSLMGTNLQDFFLEANRVLKIGGIIKIAEVESRFDNVTKFIENVSKCGFVLMNKDLTRNLFYFLTMKKIKNITKNDKCISAFSLKPCLYKKR